ncbi:SDR family oxidoreductase [Candidatus Magnetaquicoccus inordinatus]|uniref:SDR family oxidoreductase n=1 Tax=Candidatus Magnetaquicoccus inordinatus TaxID=2496818 RepID=UPI00187D57DE|nr:SDR family oxidoreductase [Candidatus Magnetaquicoccus inordinatus]
MRLQGKVAMVTGAVGQLGRQFCRALALEGAEVWVTDLDRQRCQQVAEELPHRGASHHALALDVGEPQSVQEAMAEIKQVSAALDIVINNAGIAVFTPFEERSFEDFMRVLRVNTGGTFLCIQQAAQLMRQQGRGGSIINLGSIYGEVSSDPRIYTDCGRKNSECYSASKAGIIMMTRYFAVHLAPFGIRVNCISPGGIFNQQGEDFVGNYSRGVPMARMGQEEELNGAAVFLASDESRYMTGQNLIIDGGRLSW